MVNIAYNLSTNSRRRPITKNSEMIYDVFFTAVTHLKHARLCVCALFYVCVFLCVGSSLAAG
jgi:hypothetical protein